MKDELTRRIRLLGWAIESLVLSGITLALFIVTVVSAALAALWVSIPVLVAAIAATRRLAAHRRASAGARRGVSIESPYLRATAGARLARMRDLVRDPATRRDLWWLLVDGSVGMALSLVAVIETLPAVLFWWLPGTWAIRAHAALDGALLAPSEKSRLALRVQQLTESRAETVDTSAADLRRIERDLHDGAQARLVSLGMSLALAEREFDRDPDAARVLINEARESSSVALAELRDLVRGIHPPVLADRGLGGAVRALALAAPIPVELHVDVADRLPPPVESAGYFAIAEALTNAIKHSGAGQITIMLRLVDEQLQLVVGDDGCGGADPSRGGGLRGIARRLSALDGTLDVTSPAGGPTSVAMVLPCASSSPKISPSFGMG